MCKLLSALVYSVFLFALPIVAQADEHLNRSSGNNHSIYPVQMAMDEYPGSDKSSLKRVGKEILVEVAPVPAKLSQSGFVFRDCAECPDMVVIPPGSFNMGSENGHPDERPVHRVTINRAFAMGKTEVTQAQWRSIMGNNPSEFKNCGDNCPVEKVSWDDAQEFIRKLNARTGKQYRLPSEAEWEYACLAGEQLEYCGSANVERVAWYGTYENQAGNSGNSTNPVATKQANAFGLYDMSGNVYEWVEDSYHDSYIGAPSDGSVWQGDESKRVVRGGSWYYYPLFVRAAGRLWVPPAYRTSIKDFGFRLVRMLPSSK